MEGIVVLPTEKGNMDYTKIIKINFEGWPDDQNQRKILLDLNHLSSGAVMIKKEMEDAIYQSAEIEFRTPEGITNHLILSIQSSIKKEGIYGYMVIVGYDPRLCGNRPIIPCQKPYMGIEKSSGMKNWIFKGVPVEVLNNQTYKLRIESKRSEDDMEIHASLYSWEPKYGWVLKTRTSHSDYNGICETDGGGEKETVCDYILGKGSFFGDIFSNKKTYWDHYRLIWK